MAVWAPIPRASDTTATAGNHRCPAEDAETEADVLDECSDETHAAGLAIFLFDLFHAAKLQPGAALGFCRRPTGPHELGDLILEVKAEFLVHFHFHGFPAKEGAQTQPQVIQHERLLSGLEDLRHGGGEGAPSAFLKFQLFAPQPSQFIKLGAAIVLRYSPARGDPVLALQAMERGIQRALLHKQNFAGNLVDALRNRPAVQGLQSDGAENQEVQSALREIDSAVRHSFPYHFYREDSASLVEAQGESRNRACSGMSGG